MSKRGFNRQLIGILIQSYST